MGLQTDPSTLEINMENSQKKKRNLPYDQLYHCLVYAHKTQNTTTTPQILAQHFHCSSIQNSWEIETN